MSLSLNVAPAMSRPVMPDDWTRAIVVATNGRASADVALLAASRLAGRESIDVVSVVPTEDALDGRALTRVSPEALTEQRDIVVAQVARIFDASQTSRVTLRSGHPPAVIASFAEVHGASLLVAGIGKANVLERLRGDETTLRLARMTRIPLFAVASGRAVPPRTLVVATDFEPSSMKTARLATAIAGDDAEVFLVHVSAPWQPSAPYGALKRFADNLQTGFRGFVRPIELGGDPATELLAFAALCRADVIAIGAHGRQSASADAIGSVATRVVRCSTCSVLLAPAEGSHARLEDAV
jgi:nucleotide-binding universal stress UspA family protein